MSFELADSELSDPDSEVLLQRIIAFRDGDFTARLPLTWTGVPGKLADAINEAFARVEHLHVELQRVRSQVVDQGLLDGGTSPSTALGGHWRESQAAVDEIVRALAGPLRETVRAMDTATRGGDLSAEMPEVILGRPLQGEVLELARSTNQQLALLRTLHHGLGHLLREVGAEGRLGAHAQVERAQGAWRELRDAANAMSDNLAAQVRDISQVTAAIGEGDLARKVTVDARGELLALKSSINAEVELLGAFSSEVTRVAQEVGSEGKLGGQARVEGVSGTWRTLTDSVNFMAANLTSQVRNIVEVTTAVATGDLSRKITVDVQGEMQEVKTTINRMVDQLNTFASEVTRVAREVGDEGRLGGQAKVEGVSGTWRDLTDSVNGMANNLTSQVRNIAEVTKAVANGDLSRKITVDVRGEFLDLKNTINRMVDQLNAFASEVTRVAREVGTEGTLGGQARVEGVSGTWKDLTDSVNGLAANLTSQVRNIAEVTTAVAYGDLSRKITVDVRGEVLELKNTVNRMVDQLNAFASEVTRVAREVGSEGKLGGQARVEGVSGTWRDLTDSVNGLASNLTAQLRDVSRVSTAIANGDLGQQIVVEAQGEVLRIKETINTMVDQLRGFSAEVSRVAREVGTEGKLGGQARVEGVSGTWKDLTDNVNAMANNLTGQVRNIAEVTTAVANGDLSRKITVDVRGEILELKNTVNRMVDQLNAFASEVTRVAREVGTEGRLGGQARVEGVGGTWKDLTDSVNAMAANLTGQVRNIAEVTTAVANGDLSRKITVDVRGEILELKNTVNRMVDQLNAFASEVTRVAREVGNEGKLGGQARVEGVSGTWKDLTDSVNGLASNLTAQLRDVSRVATAIATGDLGQKITVEAQGEVLRIKETINTMVEQLRGFSSEVSRVAREVGTEGKLGGQAMVPGSAGTWRDLTENVNAMAANLTGQVRNIAEVTIAIANGDLSKKITVDVRGEVLLLKDAINTMVDQLRAFAAEVTRVAREVGTEGRLGGQANLPGVGGTWKDLTDSVNTMASNLTAQVRNIASVTTAVANGDLSKKITVDVRGEILELKNTINTMVDQLNSFSAEVTRVARETGTEGKLGGLAQVPGVAGVWKELTENVNQMADNLTSQVRGIAKVVTGVAEGNLRLKLTVPARGEVAALSETINAMVDTLAVFSDQVTTVAREVGVEGRLGGQASVPGAAGTWKDLVDNVNLLAANLTTQVRAIAEVSTAVTKGDLTRSVQVEARGEVDELKNNINEMIRNLRDTTARNAEQDWLKSNLARMTRLLQGQRDLVTVAQAVLSELAPLVHAPHAVFYIAEGRDGGTTLELMASYGYQERHNLSTRWHLREGIVGQCAFERQRILLTNVPPGHVRITTGLGESAPANIVAIPILFEGQVKAVVELAAFERFTPIHLTFLDQLAESLGVVLNSIESSAKTEELLKQSQRLTGELSGQQEALRRSNVELEEKAEQLADQNRAVEDKNRQVQRAQQALEEKAEQLALTSKYKSEFLANMSHELRTPLNSLLLLAQQLGDNSDGNLTSRQVEYAQTIYGAGTDLLNLINDILDLSRIEARKVQILVEEVAITDVVAQVERTFRPIAHQKGLEFRIDVASDVPGTLATDGRRLVQILKNLLSNAFKFTERGSVTLDIRCEAAAPGQEPQLRFAVTDTGIGIPREHLRTIFEAFQQGDSGTARKYGGAGLGLAISRELAGLLGGGISVESEPGRGSTFTLRVPLRGSKRTGSPPLARERQAPRRADEQKRVEFDEPQPSSRAAAPPQPVPVTDDRAAITPEDRVLLVVEDDPEFARQIVSVARAEGFKVVWTPSGAEALTLATNLHPAAIAMDMYLPDLDGWSVLDRLKGDPALRAIPVDVITIDEDRRHGIEHGAFAYLTKPVLLAEIRDVLIRTAHFLQTPERHALVASESAEVRGRMIAAAQGRDVTVAEATSAEETFAKLKEHRPGCIVLDASLPEAPALLRRMQADAPSRDIPIVVFGQGAPALQALTASAPDLPLRQATTAESLAAAVALYLHRQDEDLPAAARRALAANPVVLEELAGASILIVDDDPRNLFAMASVVERRGARAVTAETGDAALGILRARSDIDAVLLDIMMPGMDGYAVLAAIRADPSLREVPVIAVTAKALPGDREKCIQAGATDYLAKPISSAKLVSTIRHVLRT